MEPQTHLQIDAALCGTVVELQPNRATVRLVASEVMRVDERGLIHGSFVFGAADYAAMLAVNDPNVVLGSAEVRFLAPIVVGDVIEATAEVESSTGREGSAKANKCVVVATARVGEREVFRGTFVAFVLAQHVLG